MQDLIDVSCFTNLDIPVPETWPTALSCRPIVGDMVQARSGRVLKIVRITHCTRPDVVRAKPGPYLKLELHQT